MPRSRQQFEQRVTRLEAFARRHPTLFSLQLIGLVAFGLAMIPVAVCCALLVLALAVCTFRIGSLFYLIECVVILVKAAVQAAWMPLPRPGGIELRREEAPGLFAALDELARRLQASPQYQVLLDNNPGASVTQRPRFGPLGWQQNYITFGLPLLLMLSREHFLAVMAHEMTHLSRQHHRFSLWVWRARSAWERFADYLEMHSPERAGTNRFFAWYDTLITPYSFVLSRLHEIEACRQTGQLLTEQTAAEMLVALQVQVSYLADTFWPAIDDLKASQPSPPRDFYLRLQEAGRQPVPAADQAALLTKALNCETDFHDPHLALRDDLQLLGFPPRRHDGQWELPDALRLPDPPAETAADALLGESQTALIETFNHAWWLEQLDYWLDRQHAITKARRQLDAWNGAAAEDESVAQRFERAMAVLEVSGLDDALPLFHQVLAADPEHPACHFELGQALLRKEDDAGIEHLRWTIAHDADYALKACRLAHRYYHNAGRAAEARTYDQLAWETQWRLRRSWIERYRLDWKQPFVPHDWRPEEIATLCRQLEPIDNLKAAYLVQHPVTEFPKKPHFVLGVFSTTSVQVIFSRTPTKLWQQVTARMDTPRDVSVYVLDQYEHLTAKFTAVPGSLIFYREFKPQKGKPHATGS